MKQVYKQPVTDTLTVQLEGCIATSMETNGKSGSSDRGLKDMNESTEDGFDW